MYMGNLKCLSPGDLVKFQLLFSSILLMFSIDEFTNLIKILIILSLKKIYMSFIRYFFTGGV